MSNITPLENVKQIIMSLEPDFSALAKQNGCEVSFRNEAAFALNQLKNNSYLASVALKDVDALKAAILKVALIGLSLNDVKKQAYLVPRDGKICLDISYLGLIHLAESIGAIKYATAELVFEQDTFKLKGIGVEPEHVFSPFADRGKCVGAYCTVKTHDNEFLTTTMHMEAIESIRNRSTAYRAYMKDNQKTCPWVTDFSEMAKKTVIKRAYKLWPKVSTSPRFEQAIDVTNHTDEIDLGVTPTENNVENEYQLESMRIKIQQLQRSEEQFLQHLVRVYQRDLKTLQDLTKIEVQQAHSMLDQFLNIQNKKTQPNIEGTKNEVAQ